MLGPRHLFHPSCKVLTDLRWPARMWWCHEATNTVF